MTGLSVENDNAVLTRSARHESIIAIGSYEDGILRNATSPVAGTTYESLDPTIASVSSQGLVTGRRVGTTAVTVTNGSHQAIVYIQVESAKGDGDADGVVGEDDATSFIECFSGAIESAGFELPSTGCRNDFDFDSDSDVDCDDVQAFLGLWNGLGPNPEALLCAPCAADADGDRDRDLDDLQLLLFNFGGTVPANMNGDGDGDGDVDLNDLQLLLFYFGSSC